MSAQCLFGFPNWVDWEETTFSGGDWDPDLPLTNLQEPESALVAQSTDTALENTTFDVDFGQQKYLYLFAIPWHNMTRDAEIRIQLGNDDTFSSSNYDTGWVEVYPQIYPPGMPSWGDPGLWDGYLSQSEYEEGWTFGWVHVLSSPTGGRYLRVEIDDYANPDAYVSLGRLFAAGGYQPSENFINGVSLGLQSSSSAKETDGGATFHKDRPRRRTCDFSFNAQAENEAMVHIWQIMERKGTSEQIFFVYDIEDTYHLPRRSFPCTLQDLPELVIIAQGYTDYSVRLVEEL